MAWGNVTVDELRAGVGSLRVECLSGHHGVVEDAYTTNVGARWHALVAFDDGRKGPCLLTNMRHEDEHQSDGSSTGCTPCEDCGDDTFPTWWHAPDDLWASVVGRNDIALCPGCFVHRAHACGKSLHFEAVADAEQHSSLRGYGGSTEHATFTRCPECGHATVGLRQPFSINHAKGCSMPTADPPDLHSSARVARFSILPPDATPGDREVSISCAICFDSERGCWHASGSGFHGTGDSQSAAALACFEAWMTTRQGWFESNE